MINRRHFLATSGTVPMAANIAQANARATEDKITVGVMGLSRGLALALDLGQLANVEVRYLCDVDTTRAKKGLEKFEKQTGRKSQAIGDFRRILEDSEVDALVCAAPNHWHAPATIMACKAGKHVYVEKPCSHNAAEGEIMVQAAEKYGRCVQLGTQRRSAPGTRNAIELLHKGEIGTVQFARCYYSNLRGSIGTGTRTDPPTQLDYDLWQGPAPKRDYQSNVVHYNWHWFWHWGGGELGNNGPHALDLCRWGLGVDYPVRTVSSGSRTWFKDDQETPDVQTASFEFEDGRQITWSAASCNKHQPTAFCTFFGDRGTLELDSDGKFRRFDKNGKLADTAEESSGGQREHLQNFIDCVRKNDPSALNQPILEGHKSTLLCHLGNIALRTQKSVVSNPESGRILVDKQQQALWSREYAKEWADSIRIN